jgi:uncharacterized protein (DUF2267 family)
VNYDEMVRAVADRTGTTRAEADELIVNTLTVLAERVGADETRDLLAQLPKTLKTRIPIAPQPSSFPPDEFVARVGKPATGDDLAQGEAQVRAVLATLTDAVNAGEMRDIAERLGNSYADLLGRPQPETRRTRDRTDAPRTRAAATVSQGVGAALDVARAAGNGVSRAAGDGLQRFRATVERVPAAIAHTLRRAGAIGARRIETIADAVEDAADAVENSAERAGARFEHPGAPASKSRG